MTQEEKELLLQDLCARLPYGIYANLPNHHLVSHKYYIYESNAKNEWTNGILYCAGREQIYGAKIEDIQPYLRPISSMTKEEENEFISLNAIPSPCQLPNHTRMNWYSNATMLDWLNARHFDYRGLINKGLALEAPEDMYKED